MKKPGFKFAWSSSILGNLLSAGVSLFSSLSRVALRLSKEGKKASWTIWVNSGVEPDSGQFIQSAALSIRFLLEGGSCLLCHSEEENPLKKRFYKFGDREVA